VFGLGAMLYELLTGRPPFQGLDNAQVIEAVLSGEFPPVRVVCPEAPAELAAIAERALRRDPAERYPDAAAFASELLAYRAGARVEAYSYGSLELVRKFVQRNPALSVAIAASVLILIGAALQWRSSSASAGESRVRADRACPACRGRERLGMRAAYCRREPATERHDGGALGTRARQGADAGAGERLTGGPGAFTDVDVLSDGTLVALETRANLARLYDASTGQSLWTAQMEEPIQSARITSGAIRLLSGHLSHILDEHTPQELFMVDGDRESLCRNGPATRRVRIQRPGVLYVEGAEGPRIEVHARNPCAISGDGTRLAIRDLPGIWCTSSGTSDARREITPDPRRMRRTSSSPRTGWHWSAQGSSRLFGGPGRLLCQVPGRSASGFAFVAAGRRVAVSRMGTGWWWTARA
jgi:hypothetical protein